MFTPCNQLLAALTLIAAWFVALPAAFMATTTIASLLQLLPRYFTRPNPSEAIPLVATNLLLLALAIGVLLLALWQCRNWVKHRRVNASVAGTSA